jgi:hypothetical protein
MLVKNWGKIRIALDGEYVRLSTEVILSIELSVLNQ